MSDTTSSNPSKNPENEHAIEEAEVLDSAVESGEAEFADAEGSDAEPVGAVDPGLVSGSPQQKGFMRPFLGLVVGGALAAGAGFFAAIEWWPQEASVDASKLAELQEVVSGQQITLTRLENAGIEQASSLARVASQIEETSEIDGIQTELETLRTALRRIEARVEALETRPFAEVNPDGTEALQAQLEAFRQELDRATAEADAKVAAARLEAEQIEADADATARSADRSAALAALKIALDTGAPLTEPLKMFDDVPPVLAAHAEGVPTLAALQSGFPDAARNVLSLPTASPENASVSERLAAFLKRQTNARSLSPKEGDDPDAVLSRAEARLELGDVSGALNELQTLPDEARTAMADWLTDAETRAAVIAAHADLSAIN